MRIRLSLSALLASLMLVGTPAAASGVMPILGITPEVCKQLQDQCALPMVPKPIAKPKPERHRTVAYRPSRCVAYRVEGAPSDEVAALIAGGYPMVARPLRLELEFYEHDDDLYRLSRDPCFYAVDSGTHERLGLLHDCESCSKPGERQAVWPEGVALGTTTKLVFYVVSVDGKRVGLPSGSGVIYLPRWFVASSIWCFGAVDASYRRIATFGNSDGSTFTSLGDFDVYYDEVTIGEDHAFLALQASTFPRILRPAHAIGQE